MIGIRKVPSSVIVLAAFIAAVGTACTSPAATADKAGGPGATVVLKMANIAADIDHFPPVQYFVERVQDLSGGRLRIAVVNAWANYAPDAERQVVRAVASAKVDLGSVGTRVFDTMGVDSFEALEAPMLIDSYALEAAVIQSDLPTEMLQGLRDLGVDGLAVLGDGLRKPVDSTTPLLAPLDWHGIRFGTLASDTQAQAIRSLGAAPVQVLGPYRAQALKDGTIQGFEMSLLHYHMNGLERLAPYVTANVNLWPQMDVLMVNPARFAALSEQDQRWLRQAASDAIARSTDLANTDAQNLILACKAGARFEDASPSEQAALRDAFTPVYRDLARNAQTKAFIQAIEELKSSTAAEQRLSIPEACTGPAPAAPNVGLGTTPTSIDGTYRWTITKQDALASSTEDQSAEHLATFPWVFTATLKDGTWTLSHTGGQVETDSPGDSYSVDGSRIAFNWAVAGRTLTFSFTHDGSGNLHLKPIPPMDPGDVFVWTTHPWMKISD
jgi:TRAP-type C4-dicarboxylate transport system substrate-binding protein